MTIVCTDGKTIASDGLCTEECGLIVSVNTQKIFNFIGTNISLNNEKVLFAGVAGRPMIKHEIVSFFNELNESPATQLSEHTSLLVVTDSNVYSIDGQDETQIFLHDDRVASIGVSNMTAITLMSDSYTPVEAVKAVCRNNIYCGGRITNWRIDRE